jgi:glycosyltransferase involved in cell wall biosynthesis
LQFKRSTTVDQPRACFVPNAGFRVLHVITGLDVGGAEQMLGRIAGAMAPANNITVVSLLPGGYFAGQLRKSGVSVVELAFNRPLQVLSGVFRLARRIRRERPDIVQGWMYHGDLAALMALALSGRRARTLLIWGIRCSNMDLAQYGLGLRLIVKACALLSRLPDVVTANSEAGMAAHQLYGYRPRKAVILDNGIDTDLYRPCPDDRTAVRSELGLDENARVFAMVARTDAMKDHGLFLAAMRDMPDAQGLLIGAGTQGLRLPGNVRALGRRSDVARLLPACDFIVSSSAFGEGFSNAVAEGMACGLPAIATDVGDARRIIGETGVVVPPRDHAAIVVAMRRLAGESGEQRARRSDDARGRIVGHFSLAAAVEHFTACYRSALSNGAKRE